MSLEFLIATAIGVMTAAGIYLVLRRRTFPVVLGLAFLSYAINVFLFSMGRVVVDLPPIYDSAAPGYSDPLPQALVLTAIVIAFGMTAFVVILALRAYLETGTDQVDGLPDAVRPVEDGVDADSIIPDTEVKAPPPPGRPKGGRRTRK